MSCCRNKLVYVIDTMEVYAVLLLIFSFMVNKISFACPVTASHMTVSICFSTFSIVLDYIPNVKDSPKSDLHYRVHVVAFTYTLAL